jgi:hypothetical protein
MATWTTANGVDCKKCKHQTYNQAFNNPLLVCTNTKVFITKATDMPACIVARSMHGRCKPEGKHFEAMR